MNDQPESSLRIGWAQGEITPPEPVLISGQFHARVSEGVETPLITTALALDSGADHVVMVSCDLVVISDELRQGIRQRVAQRAGGLDPMKLVIHATHSHTSMKVRAIPAKWGGEGSAGGGVDLPIMDPQDCVDLVAERAADAVVQAWESRAPGGVAYGLGHAVVGHNRRWVNDRGESIMYRLDGNDEFRHIEGFEDHSVNVLATYDADDRLTGVLVNVPCPSQTSEQNFTLSADYWHETRQALGEQLGAEVFVLPQCSAAGDQSPRPMYEKQAHQRMLDLAGRTRRQEIARRLAAAVTQVLDPIAQAIDRAPVVHHEVQTLELPMNRLTQQDADDARAAAQTARQEYEQELAKLDADPAARDQPRWYMPASKLYRRMKWHQGVVNRYEAQVQDPGLTTPAEVHILRLGEVAIASVPYEYYLDFGVQVKVRSPATQTFLVQLAGNGTYLPSPRSVAGGGYGSVPASNVVGPEAGQVLAEHIVARLGALWEVADTPAPAAQG